jgi:hypothetical protein
MNSIDECLCKKQYERKYNKIHEIHMKYKKCIGKSLKFDETQEMYREITKIR